MSSDQSKRIRTIVVYFCSAAAIAVSLIVLASWAADVEFLQSIFPNYPKMKPNTAAAFCFTGIGLYLAVRGGSGGIKRYLSIGCGIVVLLVGVLTLTQYITNTAMGIDTLLLPAAEIREEFPLAGRMSPHAALNFTIIGISLAMLGGKRLFQKISQFLIFIVPITTYAAVLGYIYGAQELYGVSKYNSMALHTAVMFMICSLGLLAANTHSRTVRLLSSPSLGGRAARRLLPAVILIPTILGWMRVIGQEQGMFNTGFGTSITVFITVGLMVAIVLFYSGTVHKVDVRRKGVEQELADKELRYRELFDYSQGMICIHDRDGILLTVNAAAAVSLGYTSEELIGRNLRELMTEENRAKFNHYLRQVENKGIANGLLALVSKHGKTLIWRYNNILVSEPGREPYVLAHALDVTELIAAQKALKNLSLTDELTGLYNRRGFLTMAEQQIKLERHEGTARGLVLMFADLDGLKNINDTQGHEGGSDAIKEFSKIVKSVLRSADLIARWGGDEFVILSIGSKDEHVGIMSDRIDDKLHHYNLTSGKPYKLACSIGVVSVPTDGIQSIESIIAEADDAMYNEKRRRKQSLGIAV